MSAQVVITAAARTPMAGFQGEFAEVSCADLGGAAVSMTQKSGEIWVFRQDGAAEMRLEPSVYLENGRLRPRASQQVVLSGRAMSYSTRIRWSLSKAQDTPTALRDLRDFEDDDDF